MDRCRAANVTQLDQGVGLGKRGRKRFEAQQMVVLLSTLAHDVLGWARAWLALEHPHLARYAIRRLVRDP